MRICAAGTVMFAGRTATPGALATSRSFTFVIGVSSTRLCGVDHRHRVADFDPALLTGRRGDDFLQLDDRRLHREVERRRGSGATVTDFFCSL